MEQRRIAVTTLSGLVSYQTALELQHEAGRKLEHCAEKAAQLFLLEHQPVFTLGRRTETAHLRCSEAELAARTGIEVVRCDRGGSITYHGPGQLTAYLLLNLQVWRLPLQRHLELLEECVIKTLAHFDISGRRQESMTGVWVDCPAPKKICAIGVSARRWVTYHGLGLNVDADLKPFGEIIPCGLKDYEVTSMSRVLAARGAQPAALPQIKDVQDVMIKAVESTYGQL